MISTLVSYAHNKDLLDWLIDEKNYNGHIILKVDNVHAEKFENLCLQNDLLPSSKKVNISYFNITKVNENYTIISGPICTFTNIMDIDFYNNTKIKELKKVLFNAYPKVFKDVDTDLVSSEFISILSIDEFIDYIKENIASENITDCLKKHIAHTLDVKSTEYNELANLLIYLNKFKVNLCYQNNRPSLFITATEEEWQKIINNYNDPRIVQFEKLIKPMSEVLCNNSERLSITD